MFHQQHFAETRPHVLREFMSANPFGTLITSTGTKVDINHLPFEVLPSPEPYGRIRAHVARANPLFVERASMSRTAVVVFLGPDAYVSPSWYPAKKRTHKVVPTWNYVAVHAYGEILFVEDDAITRSHLDAMSRREEMGQKEPWSVADAPEDYISALLGRIAAFDIRITELCGKWKVSQNRTVEDMRGVVQGLVEKGGAKQLAMASIIDAHLASRVSDVSKT